MMDSRQPLQQMLVGKVVTNCRKLKLDPCLSPCTSINSKWIKDLNIRPETLQLVHKRAGNILETISIGKELLIELQKPSNLEKGWTNETTRN
jgi:hypothetical protein